MIVILQKNILNIHLLKFVKTIVLTMKEDYQELWIVRNWMK